MRKLSGALLAGVAGVAVGASGLGVAGAATGGSFLLGRSNHETATATLTSDRGAPLALHAVKGQPPLTVNSSTMVRRLNAAEVGGLPAAALQHTLTGRCGTGIAAVTPTGSVSCATAALPIRSSTTWVVPAGVHALSVQAIGGGGGGAAAGKGQQAGGGGAGAVVSEILGVSPGERLDVVVGKGGAGGNPSAPAAGGSATVIYRQSADGETLVDAGGGHPGRAGGRSTVCGRGTGGVPRQTDAGQPVTAAVGQPGSCAAGGGAAGWPGAGGAPSRGGAGAAGQPGSVLLTVAG